MFFQPEIETMPREELRELQLERMRESLRNAYDWPVVPDEAWIRATSAFSRANMPKG